jgi:putative transcriptional regulator
MPKAKNKIIEGARQALAFARGARVKGYRVHKAEDLDVRAIRMKTKLSQSQFASRFGFSVRTLQEWEQRREVPTGAARALLKVIAHDPGAVERALAE